MWRRIDSDVASVLGRAFVISGLVLGLAACATAPSEKELQQAGKTSMSGKEIRRTLADNTLYQTGVTQGTPWKWAAHYRNDGTAVGRAWWSGGKEAGKAEWEIANGNQWCTEWNNEWGDGGRNCFTVYREGSEVTLIHKTGPHQENEVMELKEGNAYDL